MTRTVHRTLSRVFTVILALAGVGALIGGNFAHGYVADQLSRERITMPSQDALTTPRMKDSLAKWSGEQLTTGPQAEAFANDYILVHMNEASGDRTYEEVSGEFMARCARNPGNQNSKECATLGQVRQTLFMGDSLRGMLLNAYAWWLVGTIAVVAGVVCLLVAVVTGVLGWGVLRRRPGDLA